MALADVEVGVVAIGSVGEVFDDVAEGGEGLLEFLIFKQGAADEEAGFGDLIDVLVLGGGDAAELVEGEVRACGP